MFANAGQTQDAALDRDVYPRKVAESAEELKLDIDEEESRLGSRDDGAPLPRSGH